MVYLSFVSEQEAFTLPKVDSKIYTSTVEHNKEDQGSGNVNLKAKWRGPQLEDAAGQSKVRTADEQPLGELQPQSWFQTFWHTLWDFIGWHIQVKF